MKKIFFIVFLLLNALPLYAGPEGIYREVVNSGPVIDEALVRRVAEEKARIAREAELRNQNALLSAARKPYRISQPGFVDAPYIEDYEEYLNLGTEPSCKTEFGGWVVDIKLPDSFESTPVLEQHFTGTYVAPGDNIGRIRWKMFWAQFSPSPKPIYAKAPVVNPQGTVIGNWVYGTPWTLGYQKDGWSVCRSGVPVSVLGRYLVNADADWTAAIRVRNKISEIENGAVTATVLKPLFPLNSKVRVVNNVSVQRTVPCFARPNFENARGSVQQCLRSYSAGDICKLYPDSKVMQVGKLNDQLAVMKYQRASERDYGNSNCAGCGWLELERECPDGTLYLATSLR